MQVFLRNKDRKASGRRDDKSNPLTQAKGVQLDRLMKNSAGKNLPLATRHLNPNHLRSSECQLRPSLVDDDQQFIRTIGENSPFKLGVRMPILSLNPMCYHRL